MHRLNLKEMTVPLRTEPDGTVRIGRTRVTLDSIVSMYREGCTAEEIVEQFDSLSLADVHGAIAYLLTHQSEVDRYMAERGEQAAALRHDAENISSQRGLRERLLARQARTNTTS
jgi:uncharacterized protein (DUF433 family)